MLAPAFRHLRFNAAAVEGVAVRLRIIAAVVPHKIRLPPWAAGPTAHGRHCVHQSEMSHQWPVVALVLLIFAAGCQGGSPTSPSVDPCLLPATTGGRATCSALVARAEPFEVTGVVSDGAGSPLQGIAVTMYYQLGGFFQHSAALTDAAGAYKIAFTANPWNEASGRGAARAELIADEYEWYYRTIFATGPQLVENFRLHPLQRIAAGKSVVLPIAPDDSMCGTAPATVCRTVRVTAQANGNMTVQAISQGNAGAPVVSVCCVSGNDRGGNPVTLPVTAATEFTVEVGLSGGFSTTQSVVVKTSLDP